MGKQIPRGISLMRANNALAPSDVEIRLRLVELVCAGNLPLRQLEGMVDHLFNFVKTGSWNDPAVLRKTLEAD